MQKNKLALLLCWLIIASCVDDNAVISSNTIKGSKDSLYIITKNWGVTGDNQLTIISPTNDKSSDLSSDSTTRYVFRGLDPFVYRFKNDTLLLLVRNGYTASSPTMFSSSIKVVQNNIGGGNFDSLFVLSRQKKSEFKPPTDASMW